MQFITSENELILKPKVQSFYFYATWMPFHKRMMTMIGKMEEKHKDIDFIAVDSDSFKGLCKRFNIVSIPTVLIMVNGEERKRITGLVMTSAFRSAFVDICNS